MYFMHCFGRMSSQEWYNMKSPAVWDQFQKSVNKLAKLYLNTNSHLVTNLYVLFILLENKIIHLEEMPSSFMKL